ncbi:F-box/WD repeat-containing protein 10-like [Schistocerca nitens]|uniref:F-box/WD repeat-containing protein 10-like n=1 Tax=Schistocerca nitens TaxID=7011 RepID=UPI0021179152|nr:F-box/WD repeat-containing protein 10-like [Schistocerca nitens]
MKNIDSGIFKDYSYLKSQDILEGSRDTIPADDNRTLEDVNLVDVQLQDKVWYARLKPDQQYHILNGLTTIGGCAFKRKICEEIVKLIVNKQQFQSVMQACPSVNYTIEQQVGRSLSSDIPETPDEEWMKYFEELKSYHLFGCDINAAGEGEVGEKRTDEMKGQSEIELQKHHQLWRDEFQMLCNKYNVRITPMNDTRTSQSKGIRKQSLPTKKVSQKTTFDEIQMLPENINSRIFSYLSKDAMNIVKNVNTYWTFMVNAVTKEQDIIKKVNERIAKLEQSQQQTQTSPSSEQSSVKLLEVPEPPNPKGREEVIFLLKLFNRASRRVQLAPKPNVSPLNTEFLEKRVTACNRDGTLLAVSTSHWSVTFYSLPTGRSLGYELVGHCDEITCMCFTSGGKQLITGSADTTARCWDVNKQSLLTIYAGHEGSITALSTDGDYVVTAGMDQILKVFRRLEGDCLTTTFIEHPVTCMELNLKEDLFYCGHVNGYISIFSFLTKKLIVSVRAHTDCVNVLVVKYPILVSGGSDGAVRLWNSKEPKSQCLIEMKNASEVGDLCMSEYHIFTGDQSGYVCAWNIITGQKEQELTLGGIPSPILSIHSKKNSNNVQVIANTANAVYSIQLDLWDVKNKPLFGPPHKKCCASFMGMVHYITVTRMEIT